jgi:hypothetical protein
MVSTVCIVFDTPHVLNVATGKEGQAGTAGSKAERHMGTHVTLFDIVDELWTAISQTGALFPD